MNLKILWGIFVPFLCTSLGAVTVLFLKNGIGERMSGIIDSLASGVMVAASVWSLIIPSIEGSAWLGKFSFFPAVVGIFLGALFLILTDRTVVKIKGKYGKKSGFSKTAILFFAVVLHNIPEGMAVGAGFAGYLGGEISFSSAMMLMLGIAIQNIPEGAIISLPLATHGKSRFRAMLYGVISGIVEPLASFLTVLLSRFVIPLMPIFLSFAAGAMLFVVQKELSPSSRESNGNALAFLIGFSLMMTLDVALG